MSGGPGGDSLRISVNVSARQLMVPEFPAVVRAVLATTNTDPRLLTIEITESVFLQDARRALVVLTELKQLGLLLALDDFGTGYSSLSYLKGFPVDIVKLDQSFISDLGQDRTSHAIVMKIIELAHLLDLTVVSEGVETAEQHEVVIGPRQRLLSGLPSRTAHVPRWIPRLRPDRRRRPGPPSSRWLVAPVRASTNF